MSVDSDRDAVICTDGPTRTPHVATHTPPGLCAALLFRVGGAHVTVRGPKKIRWPAISFARGAAGGFDLATQSRDGALIWDVCLPPQAEIGALLGNVRECGADIYRKRFCSV